MNKIIKNIFAAGLLTLSISALAQERTAYNLGGTSFRHEFNPALQPTCKVYINLPAISNLDFNIRNSFGLFDLIQYNDENNKDAGKKLDFDLLASVLNNDNSFSTRQNINLLGFGFKVKKLYFHFGSSLINDMRLSYPDDILTIRNGFFDIESTTPTVVDLSNIALDINTYAEISLGASYTDVIPGLTVGGKLKYLRGIMNMNTAKSTFQITTNPVDYSMSATIDYAFEGAFPIAVNMVNGVPKVEPTIEDANGAIEYLKTGGNNGFAVDLGATYKLKEKFTFGLSILDLGAIKWGNQVQSLNAKFDYKFEGFVLNADSMMSGDKDANGDSYIDRQVNKVTDEIQTKLDNAFSTTDIESYSTGLPTRVFLSANYQALKWLNVGFLSRNEFYKSKFHPGATLSVNVLPIRQVAASLSYSVFDNSAANVGAGLALRLGPLQFYTVTDNFISFIQPQNARNAYVRFGFNLMFGCKPKKEGQSLISQ